MAAPTADHHGRAARSAERAADVRRAGPVSPAISTNTFTLFIAARPVIVNAQQASPPHRDRRPARAARSGDVHPVAKVSPESCSRRPTTRPDRAAPVAAAVLTIRPRDRRSRRCASRWAAWLLPFDEEMIPARRVRVQCPPPQARRGPRRVALLQLLLDRTQCRGQTWRASAKKLARDRGLVGEERRQRSGGPCRSCRAHRPSLGCRRSGHRRARAAGRGRRSAPPAGRAAPQYTHR